MLPDPLVGCIEVSSLDWENEVNAVIVAELDVVFSVASVTLPAKFDGGDAILDKTFFLGNILGLVKDWAEVARCPHVHDDHTSCCLNKSNHSICSALE